MTLFYRGFICDSMLGRLAKNLRMLGFDSLYARDAGLHTLRALATHEQRLLLTRRTAFLKSPAQTPTFIFIRSNNPSEQLREVLDACSLTQANLKPFTLCLRCNTRLIPIDRQAARGLVPDYVFATVAGFTSCPQCGRVYWKGTHYANMTASYARWRSRGHG